MAWYAGANVRNIAPGSNDPPIKVVGAILHVDAGNNPSLFNYFNGPSGGIESHFHVRKEGRPEQYRNTGYEADANLKANSFWEDGVRKGYVSIETQGFGAGEWTSHQLSEIKALLLWLSQTHDFPLRQCRNTTDPGVGYHTLFGAPSDWTPSNKSCPGPDRKRQFSNVLVPWFADADTTPKEWDEMASQEEIRWAVRAVVADEIDARMDPFAVRVEQALQDEAARDAEAKDRAHKVGLRIEALHALLRTQLAEIKDLLTPEEPPADEEPA